MAKESGRTLITPLIFNDEPVGRGETAYFQFEHYADTFARIIAARDTRTPLTIGVHGEWGSGKTTLMRRIQAKLDETKNWTTEAPSFVSVDERGSAFEEKFRPCKTVWFNAWKYGREEALFVALIEEVLRQMRRDGAMQALYAELADPKQDKLKVSEAVISTLTRVFTAGRLDIDLTAFQTESHFRTNLAFLDEFQEVFDRLLRWYVARDRTAEGEFDEKKGVLVVFIDDLDRCLPEKAVQVLEAIKLMMGKRGTIFVLGASRRVVEAAVEAHYKLGKMEELTPENYLDKIIQLRFDLPPIRREDMRAFIEGLREKGLEDPALLDALPLITEGVPTNPRQVKTFINYLELQWGLLVASGQAEGIDREDFTRWLVLCEAARPFGEYVRRLPRTERVDFIQDAARLARQEASDEEAQVLGERYKQWRDDRRFDRLWNVLKQPDFAFEIEPDVLDRFIFLSAPPVEAVEQVREKPARPRRAVPLYEAKDLREEARALEGLLPDMVLVLAGPFLMGSTEDDELARDNEHPQHTVELPAYRIGRYPLTNAEYARFIEAGGYANPDYWTAAGWAWREESGVTQPGYWEDKKWNRPDHPMVGVSWYEAVAYCRWLVEALQVAGALDEGEVIRLPSEAEWEKAARGEHARRWPWGDDFDPAKANTAETGPGRTTPVGQYSPAGDSSYGAADMAGNVWEWCSSLYLGYPYDRGDDRGDLEAGGGRVLRGGSWLDHRVSARCASRNWDLPSLSHRSIGFRLVSPALF
ncbi:MAG: SUMF1/EgtB/PvdO family nonheme iron enzyme [Anaerolineae bacterium]|nr:SUMF1/EgtB/PvdO family nonheme iron enzyme [Anaerolineae bacterium]